MTVQTAPQAIKGGHIRITPYTLHSLHELKIEQSINDHVYASFSGELFAGEGPGVKKDSYVTETDTRTTVEISHVDENGKVLQQLFTGIIEDISVWRDGNRYYIAAKAVSYTRGLDMRPRRRSFQDKNMTYRALVDEIKKDYAAVVTDTASDGQIIGRFTLQYDETDWDFLKRMASRLGAGLVADGTANKARLYFGMPQPSGAAVSESEIDCRRYRVFRYACDCRDEVSGAACTFTGEFLGYEVETFAVLSMGAVVNFKNRDMAVYRTTAALKNGALSFIYRMAPKSALRQIRIDGQIKGSSLSGRVLDVREDKVRLHLDIDTTQEKDKAWFFPYVTPYAAEGHTGWYCMPETGDRVELYFPSDEEEKGQVTASLRGAAQPGDKITKPEIKYFRTKDGKELKFTDTEILITAKDDKTIICLNDDDGIEIRTDKEIKINAGKHITVDAKEKISVSSDKEIQLKCKSSVIKISSSTIELDSASIEEKT